jgi:3-methyladenine DNA glycosylase/8-oxoguanine DNA glycosylase
MDGELTRTWRPPWPLDVATTLAVHKHGNDPTHRVATDGTVWRTARTPDGPGTLRITRSGAMVEASAWGDGARWLLDTLPAWLGDADEPEAFVPRHALLERAVKLHRGLRVGRTGLVREALVPAILEQKVTGKEAKLSWQRLLRAHGDPAPGPAPEGLRVIPRAETLRMLPSWEWHRLGVGPDRSRTIVQAARVAVRLEEAATMSADDASRRLQAVQGIGPWTAAETIQRALGDPDSLSVGDYGLPSMVAWALAGERTADDARMLELLEPYRGQRYRACLLIERTSGKPPRHGPRMPVRDFRRM